METVIAAILRSLWEYLLSGVMAAIFHVIGYAVLKTITLGKHPNRKAPINDGTITAIGTTTFFVTLIGLGLILS